MIMQKNQTRPAEAINLKTESKAKHSTLTSRATCESGIENSQGECIAAEINQTIRQLSRINNWFNLYGEFREKWNDCIYEDLFKIESKITEVVGFIANIAAFELQNSHFFEYETADVDDFFKNLPKKEN